MLNVSTVEREVHTENRLVVGVDVSKDKLDLYADHTDPAESRRQELDGEVPNRSGEIESVLQELAGYAEEKDLEGLLVVNRPGDTRINFSRRPVGSVMRLPTPTESTSRRQARSSPGIRVRPTRWTPG